MTSPTAAPAAPAASAPPGTPPDAPRTAQDGFTHRQILVILSGLLLGMFLAALDQNIVSTSIRTIADDLNGLNLQAWATTAYLITATISTPLYGKMSDLYGRKPFFLFAIGIFVVGSVLCTIATSMYELAAFRAVQGLGAGGLMSLALTIIGDIVPPRERARYQGFFLAVFGTSSVIGPVVGGFFAGQDTLLGITGWRWVFLVNVPIGIIAFLVVMRVLNLPHTRREHRIDWPGAVALSVALVPLLIVAEQGREWGWGSTLALSCYGIGVVGLIAFIASERHYGDDALLPLRLFQNSVFSLTSLIAVITGVGMFGGIAIVPQYLQIVTGSTPTEAGLEMVPLVVGIMIASILSGQLTARTGRYKVFPIIGLGLMTVGMLLFHFLLHFDTPYWQIAILMVVFGLGLGNCMQTLVVAVQNAVPPKDMGVATASATFFRQMGGTLGVAVFLSILFSTVTDNIASAFARIAPTPGFLAAAADPLVRANPANAVALDPASGAGQIVQDSSVLQRMDPRLAEPFLVGFSDSMDLVFLCAACVIAVGFVLIWFMREIPLRTQSGIQARDAESRQQAGNEGPSVSAMEAPVDAAPVAAAAVSEPSELEDAGAGRPGSRPEAGWGPPSTVDGPAVPGRPAFGGNGPPGNGQPGNGQPGNGGPNGVAGSDHADDGNGRDGRVGNGHADDGRYGQAGNGHVGIGVPNGYAGNGRNRQAGGHPGNGVGNGVANGFAGNARGPATSANGPANGHGPANGAGNGHGPTVGAATAGGAGGYGHGRHEATDRPAVPPDARNDGPAVHGRLVSSGRGAPDVPVTLHDLEGTVLDRSRSAPDGGYVLRAPRPGTHVLIVSSARHRPHAELVDVAGGGARRTVELTVHGRAHGRVRDADGAPVVGATVTLTDATGAVRAVRHTDAAGGWEADDVDPGSYTLAVVAPPRDPVARRINVGDDARPVEVEVPVARFAVSGTLRSASGRTVPESLVVLVGDDGAVVGSTVTDDSGRFALPGLDAGRYMLTASGFAPVSERVDVTAGSPEVALTVQPPRVDTPVDGPARSTVDDAVTAPVGSRDEVDRAIRAGTAWS